MRILITGGVRSGKSTHAEALITAGLATGASAAASGAVYIAAGGATDGSDPDWDARVERHRARRPSTWMTLETDDVAGALASAASSTPGRPVLVDCLGTWLTALLDREALWDATTPDAHAAMEEPLARLCDAVQQATDIVVVTNEVGFGVVPSHRAGALFRDLLGTVNQRVAAVCDEVHLVVAGRVLKL